MILPFIGYENLKKDILSPSSSFGMCDNIKTNIEDTYLEREIVSRILNKIKI